MVAVAWRRLTIFATFATRLLGQRVYRLLSVMPKRQRAWLVSHTATINVLPHLGEYAFLKATHDDEISL